MTHPYATLAYAHSLHHWGEAFPVPEWGSMALSRQFGRFHDAAGAYPLTVLSPRADLESGLGRLREAGFVTVTLVLDDYHRPSLDVLRGAFDVLAPFKTHYVVDRSAGEARASKGHRYMVRQALETVRIETFPLSRHLDQWIALYGQLTQRHGLTGLHALPEDHHRTLAELPGVTAVGAFAGAHMLAAHIWVEDHGRVHSHLAASSEEGYRVGAAYAVNDASIRHFADARIINLGGGAGYEDVASDGLARFKRGFANAKAQAYICGKILDSDAYVSLSMARGALNTTFFPAYRLPPDASVGGS